MIDPALNKSLKMSISFRILEMKWIESPKQWKRKLVWKVETTTDRGFIDFWFEIHWLLLLFVFCHMFIYHTFFRTSSIPGGHRREGMDFEHGGDKSRSKYMLQPHKPQWHNQRGALEQAWGVGAVAIGGNRGDRQGTALVHLGRISKVRGRQNTRLLLTSDTLHYMMFSLRDASSTRLSQFEQEGPKERSQAWLSAFTSQVWLESTEGYTPPENLGGIEEWTCMAILRNLPFKIQCMFFLAGNVVTPEKICKLKKIYMKQMLSEKQSIIYK